MMGCILGTPFLFFFFPRVWKISVSGTRELECKEGENQILGTGIWPYDRAAVWEPMLYTVGLMHLLDLKIRLGMVEASGCNV